MEKIIVDGIHYSLNNENLTASVTNGSYSGSISIPNCLEHNGEVYTVEELGDSCFSGCTELESIIIPSSIIVLGIDCFRDCSNLQSVTIPNSVKELRDRCFYGCI